MCYKFRRQKCDQEEAEKILKCKDPATEIQSTWHVKTKVMPVITGANETISKSFRKISEQHIEVKYEIKELQQTATLGTAHFLRTALMSARMHNTGLPMV